MHETCHSSIRVAFFITRVHFTDNPIVTHTAFRSVQPIFQLDLHLRAFDIKRTIYLHTVVNIFVILCQISMVLAASSITDLEDGIHNRGWYSQPVQTIKLSSQILLIT